MTKTLFILQFFLKITPLKDPKPVQIANIYSTEIFSGGNHYGKQNL